MKKKVIVSLFIIFFISCQENIINMEITNEIKQNFSTLCQLLDSVENTHEIDQKFVFDKELSSLGIPTKKYSTIYWIKIDDIEKNDFLNAFFTKNQLRTLKELSIFSINNNIQSIYKTPYCGGIYVMYISRNPKIDNSTSSVYLAKLPENIDCIKIFKEGNFKIVRRCDDFYFLKEIN